MTDFDSQTLLNDISFHILHSTAYYIVGHIYEEAFLIDLSQKSSHPLGDFYGDPTCALIDESNLWCLVGGTNLLLWTPEEQILLEDETLHDVFAIRQIGPYQVQLLIDPWAEHSAIWELDIQSLERKKISNFTAYKDKPYTDNIEW